jgi:hypothetical protein
VAKVRLALVETGQPDAVLVPTKLRFGLNALTTSPTGLAIVVVLLPAKSSPTGCLQELAWLDRIKEPESPPALNPLPPMTI